MRAKTYFITSYMEFLLNEGFKYEEVYVGDASRFIRYLLQTAPADSLEKFIAGSGKSPAYRKRLSSSLNRFVKFIRDDLDISNPELNAPLKAPEAL